jgi:hypothetical protein
VPSVIQKLRALLVLIGRTHEQHAIAEFHREARHGEARDREFHGAGRGAVGAEQALCLFTWLEAGKQGAVTHDAEIPGRTAGDDLVGVEVLDQA